MRSPMQRNGNSRRRSRRQRDIYAFAAATAGEETVISSQGNASLPAPVSIEATFAARTSSRRDRPVVARSAQLATDCSQSGRTARRLPAAAAIAEMVGMPAEQGALASTWKAPDAMHNGADDAAAGRGA